MRVIRVTRHISRKNFFLRGASRRVMALHYIPSAVCSAISQHNLTPEIIEHVAMDACACEAMSFVGQVAIVTVALHAKNVRKGSSY
jgi:hypothetical protein